MVEAVSEDWVQCQEFYFGGPRLIANILKKKSRRVDWRGVFFIKIPVDYPVGDCQEADKNNRSECDIEGQVVGAGDKDLRSPYNTG